MSDTKNTKDLYQSSGVDTSKGDALVDWLQSDDKSDRVKNKFGRLSEGIGGFAGIFKPDFSSLKAPELVASTDGVGTKLLLAIENNRLEGVGQDLVAMCINDLYCVGATPLFFIDYYATGKLNEHQFKTVLTSIRSALKECSTVLMGGETAEMPGMYQDKHLDLAGFVVGVVDADKKMSVNNVCRGDTLIALSSSGFHSNGYSLIRKWLQDKPAQITPTLIRNLLEPTRLYTFIPDLLSKYSNNKLKACANITGGGITGNLERIVPDGCVAEVDLTKIKPLPWMETFCSDNGYSSSDLLDVFNCGVGMIFCVSTDDAPSILDELNDRKQNAYTIGTIVAATNRHLEKKVCYL